MITRFTQFPTAAEDAKRDTAYRAHMQRTETQLQTESGERAKYRRLKGTLLLREMVWK